MALIDRYLPDPHFRERHRLAVRAPSRTVLRAARASRTETDPFFRAMIGLRELPMRVMQRLSQPSSVDRRPFGLQDFTLLDSDDHEIVYGLAGRFWRSDFDLTPVEGGAGFLALDDPGVARLALNFAVGTEGRGICELSTETRIVCADADARAKLRLYWHLIRPVSGLIRRRTLASIRRVSENEARMALP